MQHDEIVFCEDGPTSWLFWSPVWPKQVESLYLVVRLTLPFPILEEEKKLIKFLFSHFFVVPHKGFMKVFKAFINLF